MNLIDEKSPNLTSRSINSIPEFDHGDQLRGVIDSLKNVEATTDIDELYEAIGIDLKDTSLRNVTLYPAALKYELDHGYESTRKIKETKILDSLNQGFDPVNHFVDRPYFNSLLNSDKTMIMGNRYLVFFNETEVALIPSYDQLTYNSLLESQNFRSGYNVRIENADYLPLDKYYEANIDNLPTSSKPVFEPNISTEVNANGTINVWNTSFIEYSDNTEPIFEWHYEDGSTSQGQLPNKPIYMNEYLSVSIGNSTNNPIEIEVETRGIDCAEFGFFVTRLNGRTFKFEKNGSTNCHPIGQGGYRYHYRYENGQTGYTCNPSFTHTFPSSLIGTTTEICIEVYKNSGGQGQGEIVCNYCITLIVLPNCEEEDDTEDRFEISVGSELYKILVENKVNDGIFINGGEVSGQSRTQIKRWWGWQNKKVDELCVKLTGKYYLEIEDNGNVSCNQRVIVDETWDCEINKLRFTLEDPTYYSDGRERKYPSEFKTQHKFIVDNQEYIYLNPSGDPFLILN